MEAVHDLDAGIEFEIFTGVPQWFFEESLSAEFVYRPFLSDIGLAQETPFKTDVRETLRRLDAFYPPDPEKVESLARLLKTGKSRLVMCDIAPLGIAVAGKAGIPCVLVENFTWDWIYEDYVEVNGAFSRYRDYLKDLFSSADYRIQTEPVCRPCAADLTTAPVCRKPRVAALQVRKKLQLGKEANVVMVATGGIPWEVTFLSRLAMCSEVFFVVPGMGEKMEMSENIVLLPHHSGLYHPDLVNASDAVVGKAGYSTVAEVYRAGVPFGYAGREDFRESSVLASFIEENMKGVPISDAELQAGTWISKVPDLLSMGRTRCDGQNGADQIAEFVHTLIQ